MSESTIPLPSWETPQKWSELIANVEAERDALFDEVKARDVELAAVTSQRDELLAALRQIANDGGEFCMPSRERRESSIDYHRRGDNMRDLARRVIASIEREKGG